MSTPLRQQYLEIKRRYPGMILLFQIGDFYETFDEDAQTIARESPFAIRSRRRAKGLSNAKSFASSLPAL